MNNNDHVEDGEILEWVWELVEKHDLGLRADLPRGAVMVLLMDATDRLREMAATARREQALTPSTRRRLREVIDMLTDAERLSAVCKV